MTRSYRFRPVFGRVLAAVVVVVCVVIVAQSLVADAAGSWFVLAPLALVGVGVWAVYWQPGVDVDEEGVTVRNILRTTRVPWARLVKVDTRYTLTLATDDGRTVGAWASPAPGAIHALRLNKTRLAKLPESTYVDGTVRPGDDETTDSGLPALVIRREWERHADAPDTGAATEVVWHARTAVALAALALASVASVLVSQLS